MKCGNMRLLRKMRNIDNMTKIENREETSERKAFRRSLRHPGAEGSSPMLGSFSLLVEIGFSVRGRESLAWIPAYPGPSGYGCLPK
jgi:hypothetical protein